MYPQRFGNYELLSELGEGGMGTVHLGRAPDGRIVALKTMNRIAFRSEDGHRRFERETAALRKVDDPHVAAFVDADLAGPSPYLVAEYVQGRPLDAVVAAGPLGQDGSAGSVSAWRGPCSPCMRRTWSTGTSNPPTSSWRAGSRCSSTWASPITSTRPG